MILLGIAVNLNIKITAVEVALLFLPKVFIR